MTEKTFFHLLDGGECPNCHEPRLYYGSGPDDYRSEMYWGVKLGAGRWVEVCSECYETLTGKRVRSLRELNEERKRAGVMAVSIWTPKYPALPAPTIAGLLPARVPNPRIDNLLEKIALPDEIEEALEAGADLAISISGGKDSDAMAVLLPELHRRRGWTGKIELIHADLGRVEWEQTPRHIEDVANWSGLPLTVVSRPQGDLLDRWEQRRQKLLEDGRDVPFWSSATNRYCTSEMKTGQVNKRLRKFTREGTVICALGIRAQESPARAKKPVAVERKQITTKNRAAWTWNPLFNFSLDDVWAALGTSAERLEDICRQVQAVKAAGGDVFAAIAESGWPAHPAYALGNERLSCAICILGSKGDIANGIEYQPDLYGKMVDLEIKSGFSFKQDMWLADLRPDLLTGEQRQALAEMRGLAVVQIPMFEKTEAVR